MSHVKLVYTFNAYIALAYPIDDDERLFTQGSTMVPCNTSTATIWNQYQAYTSIWISKLLTRWLILVIDPTGQILESKNSS